VCMCMACDAGIEAYATEPGAFELAMNMSS
jgi:hypothetical protein